MTRIEYDLLREREPQLRFPMYEELYSEDRRVIASKTVEELMVTRAVRLLSREPNIQDRLKRGIQVE